MLEINSSIPAIALSRYYRYYLIPILPVLSRYYRYYSDITGINRETRETHLTGGARLPRFPRLIARPCVRVLLLWLDWGPCLLCDGRMMCVLVLIWRIGDWFAAGCYGYGYVWNFYSYGKILLLDMRFSTIIWWWWWWLLICVSISVSKQYKK